MDRLTAVEVRSPGGGSLGSLPGEEVGHSVTVTCGSGLSPKLAGWSSLFCGCVIEVLVSLLRHGLRLLSAAGSRLLFLARWPHWWCPARQDGQNLCLTSPGTSWRNALP